VPSPRHIRQVSESVCGNEFSWTDPEEGPGNASSSSILICDEGGAGCREIDGGASYQD
jgi:hypothetical protein